MTFDDMNLMRILMTFDDIHDMFFSSDTSSDTIQMSSNVIQFNMVTFDDMS